jgi:pantoate--beta-alanine ligase
MDVVETLQELRLVRRELIEPVGLVPTMGFLHEGHLSLVRRARRECNSVVVSIYVNPAQFGPKEDLSTYPRDLLRDLDLLRAEGVDLVWTPSDTVMYPPGYETWVQVEDVTQLLEGALRPGHFRGVATVVAKLFNAVQPQKAYFGQKDAIEVVVCPIVREPDGLAMSSRNAYLDPQERKAALVLSKGLFTAKKRFEAGERDASHLREVVLETLASEPLVKVQYVSCVHPDTLQEIQSHVDQALISLAVYIGKTRLIDNVLVGS